MLMMFFSRLSLSITAISLVVSLILILLLIPYKTFFNTWRYNPIARAALLLYVCFIVGALYGQAPLFERLHVLKQYLFLLWLGILITFFYLTQYKQYNKQYIAIFVYGTVLVALLGCVNAWHWIDITHLVHHRLITDPPEYPFGTFSFSLSFAAYLSIQQIHANKTRNIYYYINITCFLFLSFFIFFISHQRTAYILYSVLFIIYGYQHYRLKGVCYLAIALLLILFTAYNTSRTFHDRTIAVTQDVHIYIKGDPISSTGLRLFFLKTSYHLWTHKPLLGFGTGSFKSAYLMVDGYNVNGQKNTLETALDQPHSDYAYILVQLGLLGFAFFLWLLGQQYILTAQLPLFERQCAQALILSFMVGALDTTQFFYANSITTYLFFTALFYAHLKQ